MSAQTQSEASLAVQQLTLASVSFTLVVYDHIITFAQEVTFFWSSSWSTSRILYFSIRYLALIQVCLAALEQIGVAKVPSYFELDQLPLMNYAIKFIIMTLCQCVITLRVWHLFPPSRSRFIRWLAVTVFIASLVAAAIFVAIDYDEIRNVTGTSVSQFNLAQALPFEYGIYLPALVVHTTMFLLTLYRFRVSPRTLQQHGMIHRFVKEGMFMYAFAAGTMLHEIIGLSSERRQDISVYDVAILGEIVVAATVISVCRAMLSIRSLAATHHVDPAWLLNHAELSRVQWRMGTTEGEILVEVNEMDVVVPSRSLALPTRNIGREDEMQRLTHSRGNRIGV